MKPLYERISESAVVMEAAAGKPFSPPTAARLEFDAYGYGVATYNGLILCES